MSVHDDLPDLHSHGQCQFACRWTPPGILLAHHPGFDLPWPVAVTRIVPANRSRRRILNSAKRRGIRSVVQTPTPNFEIHLWRPECGSCSAGTVMDCSEGITDETRKTSSVMGLLGRRVVRSAGRNPDLLRADRFLAKGVIMAIGRRLGEHIPGAAFIDLGNERVSNRSQHSCRTRYAVRHVEVAENSLAAVVASIPATERRGKPRDRMAYIGRPRLTKLRPDL